MKQLRILTGRHAGARLRLIRQRNTLGSGSDADLQIADWKHQPVQLTVEEGTEVVRLSYAAEGKEGSTREAVFEDFMPRRFDDIVLCVGPDNDTAWPSDVDLLGKLLKAKKERREGAKPAARHASGWAVAGGVACTVLLATFGGLVMNGANKAEARVPVQPLQVRVAGALAKTGLDGLTVREAGRKVVVEGLVGTTADVARTRATLQPFGDAFVVHKYAAASDVAQSISDALSDPELRVRYQGSGVFLVEGRVLDVDKLRNSAQRIAVDLGPMIKRVDVAVTELPPPQRVHVDAMMVAGDVRYVQTRDGTKHLIVSSTETGDLGSSVSDISTQQ